jgi:S1-C subfamily serine protease
VRDGDVLLDIVSSQPIGGTISVEVYRVGETQPRTLDVTIDDRAVVHAQETSRLERPAAPDTQPSRLGLQVQEIPAEIRRTLPRGVEGVLVARVERSGAGADAGLASGMIITQIIEGRQQAIDIGSIDEFRRAERMLERSSRIVLVVMAQSADGAWIRGFRPIVVP